MPSPDVSVRSLSEVEKCLGGRMQDQGTEDSFLHIAFEMRRGSSENTLDVDLGDGSPGPAFGADVQRSLDHLQQKILKVTEQLKIEQTAKEQNVAEYLKLVNSADKQQMGRIKQVFEKKNQKSAQNIAQMQKKLELYHRKMKDIEIQHRPTPNVSSVKHSTIPRESTRQLLRDITGSGRHPTMDKIKTIGPGVSLSPPFFFNKPREFANLIRYKFGSADNISHLKSSLDSASQLPSDSEGKGLSSSTSMVGKPKYSSDDECSLGSISISSDSNGNPVGAAAAAAGTAPSQGEGQSPGHQEAEAIQSQLALILEEVKEIKDAQSHFEDDMEELKTQFQTGYGSISQTMQDESYRYEHLEDQLSDLTELHQNEMAILKQELASIEERVTYQAHERARDMQEALESFETRMSKLEIQLQQQQTVQLESHDARILLGKSINIMLAIITVILVCVSTVAKFAVSLMRSRYHVLLTLLWICFFTLFWKNWDHLHYVMDRLLLLT